MPVVPRGRSKTCELCGATITGNEYEQYEGDEVICLECAYEMPGEDEDAET